MDANAPGTFWRDTLLQRAARGRVELPLLTHERSRSQQNGYAARIAVITTLATAAGLATILVTVLVTSGPKGGSTADLPMIAAVLLLGLPVGIGLIVYLIFWLSAVRRVRDGDGHPYRFEATADAFAVTRSDGTRIAAPWQRWTYRAYRYTSYHGSPIAVRDLELACDGRSIVIHVPRTRRARQLLRAVLQRLAAHGAAAG
jgi:hypothetical protein